MIDTIRRTFPLESRIDGHALCLRMAMPSATAHIAFQARMEAIPESEQRATSPVMLGAMLDLLTSCLCSATWRGEGVPLPSEAERRALLDGLGIVEVGRLFGELMARLVPDEGQSGK